MSFKVESPAEAYAAVSLLVVGADGIGTMEERSFLFDELGHLGVFSGHDSESFGALLGATMGRMVADLSDDGSSFRGNTLEELCAGARGVLDSDQCGELFSTAARLAASDGLADAERTVLMQLAAGLGVEAGSAEDIIAKAAG